MIDAVDLLYTSKEICSLGICHLKRYWQKCQLIKKGELDKALSSFEKGIQTDPKEALNYAGKGYAQLLKNNPFDALSFSNCCCF